MPISAPRPPARMPDLPDSDGWLADGVPMSAAGPSRVGMAGRLELERRAVTATSDQAIAVLNDVLAELASEQAGMAQSLLSLIDCAAGSPDRLPEPALVLAEETLAHARASVLVATYLVRMIDGCRRRSQPPAEETPMLAGKSPPAGHSTASR